MIYIKFIINFELVIFLDIIIIYD